MGDELRKPIASFLHISDLHLGASFEDCGKVERGTVWGRLKSKRLTMQAHNQQILMQLPLTILRLWQIKKSLFRVAWADEYEDHPFFDRVIVSGDISTAATNIERFAFAFGYLTSRVPACRRSLYASQSGVGLRIDKDILLCVPGNHDKMHETTLERYDSSFSQVPAACPYVHLIHRYSRDIVFLGLDSNDYSEGMIAAGAIDNSRLAWLTSRFQDMETIGLQDGEGRVSVEQCRKAIRCLLLHHHPVDLSPWKGWHSFDHFSILDGADKLLELIKGRVDIVFHGHEHYPIYFPHSDTGTIIISAGSASEWNKKCRYNSLFTVTLFTDNTAEIQEYVWNGTDFEEQKKQPPQLPLKLVNLHSRREGLDA
jgi:3',5'-cyclic AMP phosphodiesterase CpdA